jgi:hypothetical protein
MLMTLFLAGCASGLAPVESRQLTDGRAPADYADAAARTDVPVELLLALSKVETGLQMVVGAEEFPGQEPAYGAMALRGADLELGAELAGLTVEEVKTDRDANVLAAAHLLAHWAEEEGLTGAELGDWAPLVARFGGVTGEAAAEYVHYEVYATLAEGLEGEGFWLEPIAVEVDFPLPAREVQRGRDADTVWTPSPNYNSRSGADVDFVIVHTCESSYSGCWSWLTNRASGVSAHYVVNDDGSEVRALVDEDNRAWHIGASYDCGNNDGVECWRNGSSVNSVSVGIEHAGFASFTSWNGGLIERSAELACGITERHGVPRDSYHIVGHGQLQPHNRTDPGASWPWADYLAQIDAFCGEPVGEPDPGDPTDPEPEPSSGPVVIDSNNGANDFDTHFVEVSGSWFASSNVSGYYNTGYWVGPAAPVSDPASFWFLSSAETCYRVEAWWPAASDRPRAVTWLGWDEDDQEVGRAVVDQTTDGGRWNELGLWTFPAGWNRVLLSRWTTGGTYAVADAVRVTPSTGCP